MYNSRPPSLAELPTSRQLLRSTILALVAAVALLTTVILPSEYGIDPTGIGRALGLTEMGEIKRQLAEEAAADAASEEAVLPPAAPSAEVPLPVAAVPEVAASAQWRDELRVTLAPGEGKEVKLAMKQGERATFHWEVEGGAVNFDLHGSGGGRSVSYEQGRNVPSAQGTLEAAFDGNHGWFWRNRGAAPVTVIVRTRGQYAQMSE